MAARLCDIAGPVEVLMPTMQIAYLPGGISAEEHDDVELRGFPGPLHVVQLTGHAAAPNDSDDDELWLHTGL